MRLQARHPLSTSSAQPISWEGNNNWMKMKMHHQHRLQLLQTNPSLRRHMQHYLLLHYLLQELPLLQWVSVRYLLHLLLLQLSVHCCPWLQDEPAKQHTLLLLPHMHLWERSLHRLQLGLLHPCLHVLRNHLVPHQHHEDFLPQADATEADAHHRQ